MNDPILLPRTTNEYATVHHESLIKEIQDDIEKIPNYLTKHHPSFQQVIHHIHSTIRTTANIMIDPTNNKECIRKIGLLIYQIMILQSYHSLWSAYLKSGLGELISTSTNESTLSYQVNIPIWPKELKALFLTIVQIPAIKDIDNQQYLNFVYKQLQRIDNALNRYRSQLNIFANSFHGYTLQIQNILQSYIDEHSHSFRMEKKHQIELLHYDYHIRASKLEYIRHRPNQFQVDSSTIQKTQQNTSYCFTPFLLSKTRNGYSKKCVKINMNMQ